MVRPLHGSNRARVDIFHGARPCGVADRAHRVAGVVCAGGVSDAPHYRRMEAGNSRRRGDADDLCAVPLGAQPDGIPSIRVPCNRVGSACHLLRGREARDRFNLFTLPLDSRAGRARTNPVLL